MSKAPCKDCQKRHPGCHDECDAYSQFNEKYQLERARHLEEMRSTPIHLKKYISPYGN